ncbi:TPA: stationary phase or STEss regulating sigma factor [Klebsiella michiganensis]|nr:stationary phase or STEss regulating sigma factor [Klebsiella michiganensis]
MEYFSDKERGPVPRNINDIPHNVWEAIVEYINSLCDKGYFGRNFPDYCPDGMVPIGTDEKKFKVALLAEIPKLSWPLQTTIDEPGRYYRSESSPYVPDYIEVLDLIQFCFEHIGKPIEGKYHNFFEHYHIDDFDINEARIEFVNRINNFFSRNGIAYELKNSGEVVRILSDDLVNILEALPIPDEGELKLLLLSARKKIYSFDLSVRYEALKDLWDFWERVKTTHNPQVSKKLSMIALLDVVSGDKEFRALLEDEAKKLTEIGNSFFIRHSEVTQVKLKDSDHLEYLFQRLLGMINLIIKKTSSAQI